MGGNLEADLRDKSGRGNPCNVNKERLACIIERKKYPKENVLAKTHFLLIIALSVSLSIRFRCLSLMYRAKQ